MLAYCKNLNNDIKNQVGKAEKTFRILIKHLPENKDNGIFRAEGALEVFRAFQKEL